MYAFTGEQQSAWRQLFERFLESSGLAPAQTSVTFRHGAEELQKTGLWFGHTCGYPLMTRLKQDFAPLCVPVFDVDGCEGRLYCSRIIVPADSSIGSLADCAGRVAAMNSADSNSGMNVLRHAVAAIHGAGPFFSGVVTTGGHLHSLEAVANADADVAAIDCVSYRLIEDWQPGLVARVRVIADSIKTFGLPFVMPRGDIAGADTGAIVEGLNRALRDCRPVVRSTLHLVGFEPVSLDDYRGIVDAERFAVERGYPDLR